MPNFKKKEETPKEDEEKKEKKLNRWILPFIILILIIFFGSFTGLFNLKNSGSDVDSDVYKFPKTLTIGKNWSYNFSNHLTPMIKEKDTSTPYIFYIGSGAGYLPDGLVLGGNGVLEGKPTGNVGTFTFEVCMEDSRRNIICKIYKLNVASETNNENVLSDASESTDAYDPFVGKWKTSSPVVYYGVQDMEDEGYEEVTAVIHLEIRKDKGYEHMGYCIDSWTTDRNSRQIGDLITRIPVHKDWDGHDGYMSPLDEDCVRYSEYSHLEDGWWSETEITYKTENQMIITSYSPGIYHKKLTLNLTNDELYVTFDTFEYRGFAEIVKVPMTFVRE